MLKKNLVNLKYIENWSLIKFVLLVSNIMYYIDIYMYI